MNRARRLGALVAVMATLLLGTGSAVAQPTPAEMARGKYIFGATGGCGCHTKPKDPVNTGGRRFDGAFGTVYSTNLTADRETGLGGWTDQQIVDAIRLGRRPDGTRLVPVHPYPTFNGMAGEDLRALVGYLRTLPPVNRLTPPKKLVPLFQSVGLPAWLSFFAATETPPAAAPAAGPARGEYLVRAVGHCGECHTPRTLTMAPDGSRFLGGNPNGPENSSVPNITPDPETGLTWSVEQIADYLATGNKPDGDVAGGLMGEVIGGTTAGYKDMTRADLLAIAGYLKSVPPVRNKIGK